MTLATLMDGPAEGRKMRVSKRAILVPIVVPRSMPAQLVYARYRRSPGHAPDGSARYVHVTRDGAW